MGLDYPFRSRPPQLTSPALLSTVLSTLLSAWTSDLSRSQPCSRDSRARSGKRQREQRADWQTPRERSPDLCRIADLKLSVVVKKNKDDGRTVQEGHESEVAIASTATRLEPSFWSKLRGIVAPELLAVIDSSHDDHDIGTLWYMLSQYGSVLRSHALRQTSWRVQPQYFVAHSMKIRQAIQQLGRHCRSIRIFQRR